MPPKRNADAAKTVSNAKAAIFEPNRKIHHNKGLVEQTTASASEKPAKNQNYNCQKINSGQSFVAPSNSNAASSESSCVALHGNATTNKRNDYLKVVSARIDSLQQQYPRQDSTKEENANNSTNEPTNLSKPNIVPKQNAVPRKETTYSPLPPLSAADAVMLCNFLSLTTNTDEKGNQTSSTKKMGLRRLASSVFCKESSQNQTKSSSRSASSSATVVVLSRASVAALADFVSPCSWPSCYDAALSASTACDFLKFLKETASVRVLGIEPSDKAPMHLHLTGSTSILSDPPSATNCALITHCPDPARGLLNASNACFINATLQGLVHVPSFASYLVSVRGRPFFSAPLRIRKVANGPEKVDNEDNEWTVPPPPVSSLGATLGLWTSQYYSIKVPVQSLTTESKRSTGGEGLKSKLDTNSSIASMAPAMRAPSLQGLLKAEVKVGPSPDAFYKIASYFDLTGSTQEDASEFLQLLCETLKVEERIERDAFSGSSPDGSGKVYCASTPSGVLFDVFQSSCKEPKSADAGAAASAGGGVGKWVTVGSRKGEEKLTMAHGSSSSELNAPSFVGSENVAAVAGRLPPSLSADLRGWSFLTAYILNGNMRSHVKKLGRGGGTTAGSGSGVSITTQPFYFLPVSLHHKPSQTIEDALKRSFEAEVVEVSGSGPANVGAYEIHKKEYIGTLPNVLLLHLKRWSTTREGVVLKIDNIVTFGEQLVIPADICAEGSKKGSIPLAERTYTLRAVVCHRGNDPIRGHYVTYLNNCSEAVKAHFMADSDSAALSGAGRGGAAKKAGEELPRSERLPLTLCDDAKISIRNIHSAIHDTPYFLFYSRNH